MINSEESSDSSLISVRHWDKDGTFLDRALQHLIKTTAFSWATSSLFLIFSHYYSKKFLYY